jgi:hypothetical protein
MAANFKILEFLEIITENLRHPTQVQAAVVIFGRQTYLVAMWAGSSPMKFRQIKNQRTSE